jgi:hypothetical protein
MNQMQYGKKASIPLYDPFHSYRTNCDLRIAAHLIQAPHKDSTITRIISSEKHYQNVRSNTIINLYFYPVLHFPPHVWKWGFFSRNYSFATSPEGVLNLRV